MRRLVSQLEEGPGTVAVLVGIVTAIVTRVGLVADWHTRYGVAQEIEEAVSIQPPSP